MVHFMSSIFYHNKNLYYKINKLEATARIVFSCWRHTVSYKQERNHSVFLSL